MIEEEIIEGNKLIAEFVGLKYGWWVSQQKPLTEDKKQWCDLDGKTILGSRVYYNKDLKFHNDWNWLILVVEKIEEPGYFCMINKWTSVYTGSEIDRISITSVEGNTKIFNTWKACILFIEWYNKNK